VRSREYDPKPTFFAISRISSPEGEIYVGGGEVRKVNWLIASSFV
jgi:hypothetical protein